MRSTDGYLALVGGTIYVSPTEEPMRDGVVLINDGTITTVGSRALVEVPQTAQLLDCSGLTITAGFWNSHVHFFERKWANAATIPESELTVSFRTCSHDTGCSYLRREPRRFRRASFKPL